MKRRLVISFLGVTTVVLPKENRKDLREIPRRVLASMRIVLIDHMDEVLRETELNAVTRLWRIDEADKPFLWITTL